MPNKNTKSKTGGARAAIANALLELFKTLPRNVRREVAFKIAERSGKNFKENGHETFGEFYLSCAYELISGGIPSGKIARVMTDIPATVHSPMTEEQRAYSIIGYINEFILNPENN